MSIDHQKANDEISTGADYRLLAVKYRPIFEDIGKGALERESSGTLPLKEVARLQEAGFGSLRVPRKYGGTGASIPQVMELLIELATADSNVAQALRAHLAFVEDRLNAHLATPQEHWFERFVRGELVGSAISEIGEAKLGEISTVLRETVDQRSVSGKKYYSTGSVFADWLDTLVAREADGTQLHAIVSVHQEGVTLLHDWEGFGQTTSGSGTTILDGASVDETIPREERFRYQDSFYQVILSGVLAGIAAGAVEEVAQGVRDRKRVYSHGSSSQWKNDPLIQQLVGVSTAQGFASRASTLAAADSLQEAYLARVSGDAGREDRAVAQAEIDADQAQIVSVELTLEATGKLLHALGSSGIDKNKGFDRFWRNARAISSHNPVLFKQRIVGDWTINGTSPLFAWAVGQPKT